METETAPRPIVVEPDRVILRGDLAREVIYGEIWGDPAGADEFREGFEILGRHLGDPKEDYYQGLSFTAVIRRLSDGNLFGFGYWEDISKHGEAWIEPNGDEHGIEYVHGFRDDGLGGSAYVFLPVEPFTVQGYAVKS